VQWTIVFHPEFEPEFDRLDPVVQDELLAQAAVLEAFGPRLGRPRVDTLKNSDHANMKELRFSAADGVWRVAFAFDPRQRDHAGGGRKTGRQRTAILPPVDPQGR